MKQVSVEINGKIYSGFDYSYLCSLHGKSVVDAALSLRKWTGIRQKRDSLITETDWTQVQDCQLSDDKKAEFLAYRQELRDIPQAYGDPDDVVWPEKPTI